MYLSRRAMEAEYPAIAQAGVLASKQVLGVPVLLDAEPLGAAFFGFQTTTRLTTAERAMALAMADQTAQALYRARLYEVSLQSEAHVRILQEVTASLADAFTVDTVASVVLRESTAGSMPSRPPSPWPCPPTRQRCAWLRRSASPTTCGNGGSSSRSTRRSPSGSACTPTTSS